MKRKSKFYYLKALVMLFITELLIAVFVTDGFVRPYLGDLLATILVYTIVMSLSNSSIMKGILLSLVISYVVEVTQYFHLIQLLSLEKVKWAKIVLGSSFSWADVLMYSAAGPVIYLAEKWTLKSKINV